MKPLPKILFTLFLTLATTQTRAATPATPPLTELPDDWSILAHAPTLDQLLAQTKPTLHFDLPHHGTLLLWAPTTTSRKPAFQIAATRLYQPKNARPQWILATMSAGMVEDADFLPKTVIPITKPVRQYAPDGTLSFGLGTENSAHLLHTDPARGTLYEIELYFQSAAEAAQGHRLVLLKNLADEWQLLANLPGDYWDDTGTQEKTTLSATWPEPHAPLTLTRTLLSGDLQTPKATGLIWGSDSTYVDPCPASAPTSTKCYIQVQPRQTFNAILKQILQNDLPDASASTLTQATKTLRTAILKLNPTLNPNQLQIQQKLLIPNYQSRQSILKQPATPSKK